MVAEDHCSGAKSHDATLHIPRLALQRCVKPVAALHGIMQGSETYDGKGSPSARDKKMKRPMDSLAPRQQ